MIFYITKLFAQIYLFVYMLAIAGQTAGPNGLKFAERTHGCLGLVKSTFFKNVDFFISNLKSSFKGTVRAISKYPLFKKLLVRLITIPLKPLSVQSSI